jgi:serine/threonine protein kinase
MELINEGDAEEYIKRQPEALLPFNIARSVLFQLAFAVYAAADKFSVKHYDIKMLNVFIQRRCDLENGLVLRYGIGSHVYALEMPPSQAVIAKLADFGTADMVAASTGQPVAISHFTTLENTPPDFLILGDEAKQGHEHDCFGMGLCMLHLFTGGFPYEEIMEKVVCPKNLKKRLKAIWEDENILEYSVVRSIMFDGVDQDECGETIGDVDETFYDTLYRFLVLFGLPEETFQQKSNPRVWKAIFDSLTTVGQNHTRHNKKGGNAKSTDVAQFSRDSKRYSVKTGTNEYIARARKALLSVDGGLELLFALCHFDPTKRATAMQVLNSQFMADLREDPRSTPDYQDAHIQSFMSFYYGESSLL